MSHRALTLVARSSSHYSRITRIYAHELGVEHDFEPVFDIASKDPRAYADNPLLRVPSLRTPEGVWFGSLGICRELARRSSRTGGLVWPEDLTTRVASNAQEVTTDGMETGVVIVTGRLARLHDDSPALTKPLLRLRAAVVWLEAHLDEALATLPPHELSFLEVSAFCFLSHLEFRQLLRLDNCPKLRAFCAAFGARPSAEATPFRFDQPAVPPS